MTTDEFDSTIKLLDQFSSLLLLESAVRNPFTTVPGAFTAAREAGLVELREGVPGLTAKGEAYLRGSR